MIINPIYLNEETLSKIKQTFQADPKLPSISLQQFLEKEEYKNFQHQLKALSYQHVSQPLTYSYFTASLPAEIVAFLNSDELRIFISTILSQKINKLTAKNYTFTWKDYIILHDHSIEKPGIDMIIDFTEEWKEQSGGAIVYVDGTGDYTRIPVGGNQLILVKRGKKVQKFVEYVNHYAAKHQRILIFCQLLVSGINKA